MRKVIPTTAFNRAAKKMAKQAKDMARLAEIIDLLVEEAPIPLRYLDHPLKGNWRGRRELHIAPDWLLIYRVDDDTVFLERTGSHADLFDA